MLRICEPKRFSSVKWLFSLLCLLSITLLNGCSSTRSASDGPPGYDIDVSKIPDAVPKREAMSKYGNIPSYRVFGKYYHTMTSSKNYHEKGIASWYGTKFHSHSTSSGERYNMLGMTAAHKTLPLPTYVQVTNLKNGKKVIVKVNDRGPFESNRLIDLSYVAAKKLGMLGHGTAYVDVKAIDPNNMPSDATFIARANPFPAFVPKVQHYAMINKHGDKHVYLQVGAFQQRIYAEKMRTRLSSLISSPILITKTASDAKHLYRVQIGPIKDVITAQAITKRLKAIGITSEKKTTV